MFGTEWIIAIRVCVEPECQLWVAWWCMWQQYYFHQAANGNGMTHIGTKKPFFLSECMLLPILLWPCESEWMKRNERMSKLKYVTLWKTQYLWMLLRRNGDISFVCFGTNQATTFWQTRCKQNEWMVRYVKLLVEQKDTSWNSVMNLIDGSMLQRSVVFRWQNNAVNMNT